MSDKHTSLGRDQHIRHHLRGAPETTSRPQQVACASSHALQVVAEKEGVMDIDAKELGGEEAKT